MTTVVEVSTTKVVVQAGLSTASVVTSSEPVASVIEVGRTGPQGPRGLPGPAAFVSADPGNRTTTGADGGLYTPEIQADPLAYYILAKA